ncbi:retinoid-inducible serine carboxypeptidase [Leptinotarsa decemlineata]|uniref:retinoid-inducible serine carboxypeptidase n=1 Tax=Leptinotarsa decemlineata TaxID=7539 RepID=UPI003D307B89
MKNILIIFHLLVAASAKPGFGPTDQEWGFVQVRENADLFWWLHYTTANVSKPTERPLIIWLQGGPGASSVGYGNFAEIGPLDADLKPRNTTWVKNANILFVDNPVGVGFSNAKSYVDLTTTNRQIADDFLVFLKKFYETLPEFKKVPLYIFCESYGGKMTAEIALVIDNAARKGEIASTLKGIGLGDSWISPIDSVLTWAPYLLNLGAVDQQCYEKIMAVANVTKQALDQGKFEEATSYWVQTERVISEVANVDLYNILKKIPSFGRRHNLFKPSVSDEVESKIDVILNGPVREALNITRYSMEDDVFEMLYGDFMKPVTSIVEELLNNTDIFVAVYNGQLDLIVDTPGTVKWIDNLKWKNKSSWESSERSAFANDGYYQGYVKKYGNFAFYWIDRSGHMVPIDNPSAMDYILKDVTNNFKV